MALCSVRYDVPGTIRFELFLNIEIEPRVPRGKAEGVRLTANHVSSVRLRAYRKSSNAPSIGHCRHSELERPIVSNPIPAHMQDLDRSFASEPASKNDTEAANGLESFFTMQSEP